MIKDLAKKLSLLEVDSFKDRKDKLISRLFMKKLENLLDEP
jgi:hypothetical protein